MVSQHVLPSQDHQSLIYRFDPWRWCLAILPCQLAKKSIPNQGNSMMISLSHMDSHQFPDFPMDSPNGLTSPSCCAVMSSGKPALRAATTMGASEELPRYCQVRSPESSSRARRVPLERMGRMAKKRWGTKIWGHQTHVRFLLSFKEKSASQN